MSRLEESLMDKVEVYGELKRELKGTLAQVGDLHEDCGHTLAETSTITTVAL